MSRETGKMPPDVCHLIDNKVFVSELSTQQAPPSISTKYHMNETQRKELEEDYKQYTESYQTVIQLRNISNMSPDDISKSIKQLVTRYPAYATTDQIRILQFQHLTSDTQNKAVETVSNTFPEYMDDFYVSKWMHNLEHWFGSISEMGVFGLTLTNSFQRWKESNDDKDEYIFGTFQTLYGLVQLVDTMTNNTPQFTSSGTVLMMFDQIETALVPDLVQKVKNWCRDRPNVIDKIVCVLPNVQDTTFLKMEDALTQLQFTYPTTVYDEDKVLRYLELDMKETAVSLDLGQEITLHTPESKDAVRQVVNHMLSEVTDILGKPSPE